MVNICTCECCDDYTKCCNYQCRNKFNCFHFDDLKWSIKICQYICEDMNQCNYKGIGSLIALPFALVFDIISCPFRCCFSFCNKCDCEKVKITPENLSKKNKKVSIIIADQPPRYNDHYKDTTVVYPIVSLPPVYTE
jgi:hypothetical protein